MFPVAIFLNAVAMRIGANGIYEEEEEEASRGSLAC